MTTIFLVRHAAHRMPELLVGRRSGVMLSTEGRAQARGLSELLAREPVAAVQASPRERAQETAAIIAAPHVLSVETAAALDEIDAGLWTGLPFTELEKDPDWHLWNSARGSHRPPRGESMQCLQDRVLGHLEEVKSTYRDETVVLVSHAEPIRAALLSMRGLSLDEWMKVDVPVASIHKLQFGAPRHRRPTLGEARPA